MKNRNFHIINKIVVYEFKKYDEKINIRETITLGIKRKTRRMIEKNAVP